MCEFQRDDFRRAELVKMRLLLFFRYVKSGRASAVLPAVSETIVLHYYRTLEITKTRFAAAMQMGCTAYHGDGNFVRGRAACAETAWRCNARGITI